MAAPDGRGQCSRPVRLLNLPVMEPGSLIMERKMLLGIKQRAEDLARRAEGQPGAPR